MVTCRTGDPVMLVNRALNFVHWSQLSGFLVTKILYGQVVWLSVTSHRNILTQYQLYCEWIGRALKNKNLFDVFVMLILLMWWNLQLVRLGTDPVFRTSEVRFDRR